MKIKHLFPLVIVACSLLPATSIAAYDTTIPSDGSEVKDTVTGLIWRRCPEPMTWVSGVCTGSAVSYTHEAALTLAKNAATASSPKAWRLPNIKELSSISQLGVSTNPSVDTTAFPNTPSNRFWSSSPYVGYESYAWSVNFFNGDVSSSNRNGYYYVRLVR